MERIGEAEAAPFWDVAAVASLRGGHHMTPGSTFLGSSKATPIMAASILAPRFLAPHPFQAQAELCSGHVLRVF